LKRLYQIENWKWYSELQGVSSPEKRAELFYDKYKDASEEKRTEMLKTANHVGGIRTKRFNKKLRELIKGD